MRLQRILSYTFSNQIALISAAPKYDSLTARFAATLHELDANTKIVGVIS
jgi:hypothetical protein